MSNQYKVVGMAQFYNEYTRCRRIDPDFLRKVLHSYSMLCDNIVLLDDASTDGSSIYIEDLMPFDNYTIIRQEENAWIDGNEVGNKIKLHEEIRTMHPTTDLIISFDFDEVFPEYFDRKYLELVISYMKNNGYKSLKFPWIHLWFSEAYMRVDKLGQVSPPRIWLHDNDDVIEPKKGLHQVLWPTSVQEEKFLFLDSVSLLHYSSSTLEALSDKVQVYKRTNPNYDPSDLFGNDLDIEPTKKLWFNKEIYRPTLSWYKSECVRMHSVLMDLVRQ